MTSRSRHQSVADQARRRGAEISQGREDIHRGPMQPNGSADQRAGHPTEHSGTSYKPLMEHSHWSARKGRRKRLLDSTAPAVSPVDNSREPRHQGLNDMAPFAERGARGGAEIGKTAERHGDKQKDDGLMGKGVKGHRE